MLPFTFLTWLWVLAFQAAQPPAPRSTADDNRSVRPPLARDAFAGVETCRPCHAQHVTIFLATAHARTSQTPSRDAIVAPFTSDQSIVRTSNPELHYELESNADGFFETAVIGPAATARVRRQRIDLVIGSGKKGQTYLWWRGDELFQLPLSYWNESKAWAGNPGVPDRIADFTRPVIARCLDCHATFIEPTGDNRYKKDSALLGVSCEKCHGPAAAHVAARRANRRGAAALGHDVVNPARLTRDQKVDLCASCHGGQKLGPPFSFLPGDAVTRAPIVADRAAASGGTALPMANLGLDSHGQQATALMNSKCFRSSAMTCETCHDPHLVQRDVAAFSARCLTCHKVEACGRFAREGRAIVGRCVDCHMPLQTSRLIVSTNAQGATEARLRTHFIAVHDPTAR